MENTYTSIGRLELPLMIYYSIAALFIPAFPLWARQVIPAFSSDRK
jgi:predicted transporter